MLNIKEIYRRNVYGVMLTLIFHILLVTGFLVAKLNQNVKTENEETFVLDLVSPDEKEKPPVLEKPQPQSGTNAIGKRTEPVGSNLAVNDAATTARRTDKFFDDSYRRDIAEAKKIVGDVNAQLSKKIPSLKQFSMPEATTEGQNPDSIKNVIYSGKSNIHYFLENRYHIRLPIPVYLARGGGEITVDIQVDQSGNVIKANARPSKNLTDPMLPVYATQAAERTVFNSEPKAPAVQRGTITYKFVAQ